MTSQINIPKSSSDSVSARHCQPPAGAPADYCRKLKNGIGRLQAAILAQYETAFPAQRDQIARALREAEKAAWATPFPSLFFPALAHLRVNERIPAA